MTYAPKKTGPIEDLKGIYEAWWQGSRGTVWFWIIPLFALGLLASALLSVTA